MFDSESVIRYGGLLILFLAVFCQRGLFFCFFIPSGRLLFAGKYSKEGSLPLRNYVIERRHQATVFLGSGELHPPRNCNPLL
jgi:hypothetical protein